MLEGICKYNLLPPHRGLPPADVPSSALEDFIYERGEYNSAAPVIQGFESKFKALRMQGDMDRPRTRVTNFLLARDRIVDEHDCDIHPKKEVAYLLDGVTPPELQSLLRARITGGTSEERAPTVRRT